MFLKEGATLDDFIEESIKSANKVMCTDDFRAVALKIYLVSGKEDQGAAFSLESETGWEKYFDKG